MEEHRKSQWSMVAERTSEDVTCSSIQKDLISHISKFSLYPWKRQEGLLLLAFGQKMGILRFLFQKDFLSFCAEIDWRTARVEYQDLGKSCYFKILAIDQGHLISGIRFQEEENKTFQREFFQKVINQTITWINRTYGLYLGFSSVQQSRWWSY